MSGKTKYRRDIQVLRGLAVLAVVLFHANESFFPLGYLGVDAFFVISGFVVIPLILRIFTGQVNGGGRLSNLKFFYKRRFYRLAPALGVTIAISAIVVFLLGPVGDHYKFSRQGIATLLLVGNVGAYKYSGDYFSPNPNPLVHTWSLSVEEQIYVFLPLILMLITHNLRNLMKVTTFVLACISTISFVSFSYPTILQPLYSRAGIELASQISFYSPFDRIWQFAIGGLAYLWVDRNQNQIGRIPRGIHFVILSALAITLFSSIHIEIKASSILASLLAVTVIVLRSLDVLPNFLIKKLEWLGDRSYSIYLVHMPLVYVANHSPLTQIGNSTNRTIQSALAVLTSILLGALNYSKIENRFRDVGKSGTIGIKGILTALVLTFVLPLTFLVFMDKGVKNQYWGLAKSIQQPTYAGTLDPTCLRDSYNGPPCFYRNPGATKTVLLIGDSHAGHISQAFVDAAKNSIWNAVVWTHSGCHVQFQRTRPDKNVLDTCIDVNMSMKKWVKENKPNAIIVSQFVHFDSSQNDLRDALLTLRSLVPNLLLIENIPVFPDEKDYNVPRPIFMSTYKPPKSFKQSMMQTKDENASDALASWARSNRIFTMSFDSLFCQRGFCNRYSERGWLYRDDDHLSVIGAELTIPQLSAFLKQF
jgi:peptidoglycan/LPS O-acetylase OafA/YrhL